MTEPGGVDWSTYLKCPSCEQPAGQPCAGMIGMIRNEQDQLIEHIVYNERPCRARKQSKAGQPRPARKPTPPPEPEHPLAPKTATRSTAVRRRRAAAQQTMIDAWTALSKKGNP